VILDGGPAFPVPGDAEAYAPNQFGMSLRDYFAGQALAGLMTTSVQRDKVEKLLAEFGGGVTLLDIYASRSYQAADAMLKARGEA